MFKHTKVILIQLLGLYSVEVNLFCGGGIAVAAQWLEQRPTNLEVMGSNLARCWFFVLHLPFFPFLLFFEYRRPSYIRSLGNIFASLPMMQKFKNQNPSFATKQNKKVSVGVKCHFMIANEVTLQHYLKTLSTSSGLDSFPYHTSIKLSQQVDPAIGESRWLWATVAAQWQSTSLTIKRSRVLIPQCDIQFSFCIFLNM